MPSESTFDVEFARTLFPFFDSEKTRQWAFFDNAGGTFPCRSVIDLLTDFYRFNKVQPYGDNALAAAAGDQMDKGRNAVAALLGVPLETLTFGPSTTQNFNTLGAACSGFIDAGDEVIVSEQDHEANIGGWERAARQNDAILRIWPADSESGELDLQGLERLLNPKTKILCVTQSSNILGTLNPVSEIAQMAHAVGARVVIDGVSYAPHHWPDLSAFDGDVYCFSTYKTYGTHLGIMHVAPDFIEELSPQCHFFNAESSAHHLDAAGPDHASIAALAGLAEFFSKLHLHHFRDSDKPLNEMAAEVSVLMNAHEALLCAMLLETLEELPTRVIGKPSADGREANISLISSDHSSASLASSLAEKGIAVGKGHFYAYRLLQKLGLDTDDGVLRISLAHYNTKQETQRLIDALSSSLAA